MPSWHMFHGSNDSIVNLLRVSSDPGTAEAILSQADYKAVVVSKYL